VNREIVVGSDEGGARLDAFLAARLPDMSRNAVQRGIEKGEIVRADGRAIAKNDRTAPGDRFLCAAAEPLEALALPEEISLDVVFEDESLLVVNKPRGMVVHPAPGHGGGTLVNALLFHAAGSLSGVGGVARPGIVHRLDKDTSGLLLVAKTDFAHRALAAQLKDRTLSRVYEAVVLGRVGADEGTVDRPIGRHPTDRKRMSTAARTAREAVTHYTVLCRYNGYTHVRCRLETGRTHQIRVHMASIGHPLLGDLVYGRKCQEKGLSGQCLHARSLEFDHPVSGERIALSSELPGYFLDALGRLGPGV